jgi:hypothetical protein
MEGQPGVIVPAEDSPMQAATFWKTVTIDRADLLEHTLKALRTSGIAFCVIGGQGVNAYVDPVVSLDLDLALATDELERVEALFPPPIEVRRFPHSINLSSPGSDLRVQIQTDPRYRSFPDRAEIRNVLGHRLPVAALPDVLQGKVWAASDPTRRPSKRQKDLADIARLLEAHPELRASVPPAILDRLIG